MDVRTTLMGMIGAADRPGARVLLNAWAEEHGYGRLIGEVLEPVLREIGEQWEREGTSLAVGYVAGKVAEDAMTLVQAHKGSIRPAETMKGPVVVGNIEDDFHALGRRILVTFLQTDGWVVHDLGNDVPATDLVDKAVELGARIIGVSAMMYTTAVNIKAVRTEIDARGLTRSIQLAVGGAVFVLRPELVQEVGGDGTARNAVGAPALFAELWERASSDGDFS